MPIEIGLWRMGSKPERVDCGTLANEQRLEDMLVADMSILSPQLMLIGRQVQTAHGGFVDMLAIDQEGNLTVVELKKNRTPREVVAQVLDYASWIQTLSYEDVAAIFAEKHDGKEFEKGFAERFDAGPPDKLNENHALIVVAAALDTSSERIINYLADNYGVPINAVFFRYFRDGEREYLGRTWLVDPQEVETKVRGRRGQEAWNGRDFYVSLGESEGRNWDDCRKYGFISGGGGKWYIQTLDLLFPGARIYVNIPKTGYVGVGTVTEPAVPVTEFKVLDGGRRKPILEMPLKATKMTPDPRHPELCEHLVRVEWIRSNPREQAFWEAGLFANQLTVCRLRNKFTIERLSRHFGLDD